MKKETSALGWLGLGVALVAGAVYAVSRANEPATGVDSPALVVAGREETLTTAIGRMAVYIAGEGTPLILVHSINAAAAAHEVRPIFEYYRDNRRVYALDLPGYGRSERRPIGYTPRMYADAIIALGERVRAECGQPAVLLGLSLATEFVARAAYERPELFQSLVLVSPTGMDQLRVPAGQGEQGGGLEPVRAALAGLPLFSAFYYRLLVSRPSIQYFLGRTFGDEAAVPDWMIDYAYTTAQQPNAVYAPFSFLSGRLFSPDAGNLYQALRQPVLMIYGGRGDFARVPGVERFNGRQGWTIERYEELGALPYYQDPQRFFAAMDRFLERPTPQPAPALV